MKNKILSLAPDEEVQVIGHGCKSLVKIKNSEEELHTIKTDALENKSSITVSTFGFDELKLYVMFEDYYQLMMNQPSLPCDIEDCIHNLMDYHNEKIYGKSGNDLDANGYDYQCIAYD